MPPVPSLEEPTDKGSRVYILDTNVLLYDPGALHVFDEHDLVIPITVIEEIDRFKKDLNETGRNARLVSRELDKLRADGSLSRGVPLAGGGCLRVEMPSSDTTLPRGFGAHSNDNTILMTVMKLARHRRREDVVFVTRDTNMRIKADALGVRAEDYEHAHISFDELYSGVAKRKVGPEVVDEAYASGGVVEPEADLVDGLAPHQFVVLESHLDERRRALTRFDASNGGLRMVGRHQDGAWGIRARNMEQLFALELLLDDEIKLVTLDGIAGTGKTLLAIAAGLRKVTDEQHFRRLVVSRPIFPLGRDIGFLPGDLGEKLNPWMKPIFDNLDLLLGGQRDEDQRRRSNGQPGYQALIDQGFLEVEPLTYIRGRSMPSQFLLVDEAQNLTPHEIKTIITRAGDGTKIVLTGDPYQIDNPYVDATSNGLTYVIERFKETRIAGHVTLRKGERSELADMAASLL